ncbi:MarR family transcriptional regulator [Nakamurella sp. YIM 132087]|uniref:MarR family transcriptional regulator n=1 Tax=Nakamurella alba TaxID=2665158 RepID=A0A7K1FI61_9ACTN|nr:MarR family transcriptional regulator [Nakamurella alba]MTD13817.1 MarR family transcriptional regulator [Nakamurella alba]
MSDTRWLDEREARAWRALQHLRMPLELALNRQLAKDSGLSTADYSVLVALSEAPNHRLRARDLVRAVGWEKSRLSHHIRRMETRGLVTREECPTDARGAFIRLTAQGIVTIEQAAPGHVEAVRDLVIDRLTPEQLDSLAAIGEAVGAQLRAVGCPDAATAGEDDDEPPTTAVAPVVEEGCPSAARSVSLDLPFG